jgi:hypothetical protein
VPERAINGEETMIFERIPRSIHEKNER